MSENEDYKEITAETPKNNEMDGGLFELETLAKDGKKVTITRLEPKWAAGFLESIEVGPDFGLEYLINEWGGHVLKVSIREIAGKFTKHLVIPLRSFPVKVRAKEVTEDELRRGVRKKSSEEQAIVQFQPQTAPAASPIGELAGSISKIMEIVQSSRTNDLQNLGSLFPAVAPQQQSQQNPLSQITDMVKVFRELQGLFGGAAPSPVAQPAETDFLGSLAPMIGELLKVRDKQPAPSQPSRPIPRPIPQSKPQIRAVQPSPITNPSPIAQEPDLQSMISGMEPRQIADFCKGIFAGLDEESRTAVMKEFMEDMGEEGFEEEYEEEIDEGEDNADSGTMENDDIEKHLT